MSKCLGCFFHKSGYMSNKCNLFDEENYFEPINCEGFSREPMSDEDAKKLYEKIMYGDEEDG